MQVSKKKVNAQLAKQIDAMLYQLVADVKTVDEAKRIMDALLSETEMTAITKRLAVGYWLAKKRSYENIKQNIKVSSATIAAIGQELKKPGWKLAMQKVMAEEWATKVEEKIKGLLGKRKARE
jgi:uncharacterized protein YerC